MGMTFGESEDSYFTFFSPNSRYNITRFQRAYTWGPYQIQGIIDDLNYIKANDEQVGWPSILIQRSGENKTNPNHTNYDLGDGQQRVISVSLGLMAIWHHAYNMKSMGKITSDEFDYFRKIIPEEGFQKDSDGLLTRLSATERGFDRDPTIRFYSEIADKTFRELLSPLRGEFWEKLDKSIEEMSDGSGILRAFKIFYTAFENHSLNELKDSANSLLTRITLSVLEYDSDENMQRAFANMNSFGVALTEAELVKAEFYGCIKIRDPKLAEEVANYWTNNLETFEWKEKNNYYKTTPLEIFLEQYYHTFTDFAAILTSTGRVRMSKENLAVTMQGAHWLRDEWGIALRKVTNLNKFWEDFKSSIEIFKISRSTNSYTPGTLDWEINYASNCLVGNRSIPSIIMKLNLAMDNDDFKKTLRLMTKYWMYLHFVTGDSQNLSQSLLFLGSPIVKKTITYDEIKNCLESTKAPKRQWKNRDHIVRVLSKAEFQNNKNSDLCELFIYITNEVKREKHAISGLFNTRTQIEGAVKSREHIMPQTPREEMSPDDQLIYNSYVQRLGNTLILGTDLNSSAGNKSVSEKISIYEDARWSPWGLFWIDDFLKFYHKVNEWTYDSIDTRSKQIANIIADHISPSNPYSEFRSMLEENKAGDIFWISDDDADLDLTLNADATLSLPSGYRVGTLRDLRVLIPGSPNRRMLQIEKLDDDLELIKTIVLTLDGRSNSEIDNDPSEDIPNFYEVETPTFKMKSNSLKKVYKSYIQKCLMKSPDHIIKSFDEATNGVVLTKSVPDSIKHPYEILNDEYSIYVVKNKLELIKLLQLAAEVMDEPITIECSEYSSSKIAASLLPEQSVNE